MKRKVAFLDYSLVFAGAERVLYNMISHIDRSRYEPLIIFQYPLPHHDRYANLDCEKIYLSSGIKWWMGSDRWEHPLRGTDFLKRYIFGNKIANIVKREKIDILDVNLMRVDVGMWVWPVRKFTNAKIVGHYRSQEQEWVAPAYAQKLFDVIACVSKFSKMRFQLKGEFVRAEVLYDAIDTSVFKCDLSKEEAKEKLGYDKNTILLVSVGQLSVHKGHDNAIKAFSKVSANFPSARLLLAGGGSSELVNYYKQIASESGVADKVDIPGCQFDNIQEIYRAADLTLSLTKVGEGFGLVPYESALMGTPFIAPYFGAITEFAEHHKSGILIDTNNLKEIEDAINWSLNHLKECQEMVSAMTGKIYNELTPEILCNNLLNLYDSLY